MLLFYQKQPTFSVPSIIKTSNWVLLRFCYKASEMTLTRSPQGDKTFAESTEKLSIYAIVKKVK